MDSVDKNRIRVAVIDMNKGAANQGMRGIREILLRYREDTGIDLSFDVFDLRAKGECPGLDYEVYISSGGPGSPFDGGGEQWESDFFDLLGRLAGYNSGHELKKHVFLICHSFQLACRWFGVGQVIPRRSSAFGIFPVSLTAEGTGDVVFDGLPNPFFAVDSRDWQVVCAQDVRQDNEARVLALEKERPHVDLERCVMAVRFTDEIVGTQFHPEADPAGMKMYLLQEDKKHAVIASHGERKYLDMLASLDDPGKLLLTQSQVLPNFLNQALNAFQEA